MDSGGSYTALPPSSKFWRHTHRLASRSTCLLRPEKTDASALSSRKGLLDGLEVSVTEEEEAMRRMHLLFGPFEEPDSFKSAQQSDSDLPPASPVLSVPTAADPWDINVDILDKHQYLLTPIRTKLFPRASPGVLRNLLNTPSLRALTPEQSVLPSDSSLLGSPLCRFTAHRYSCSDSTSSTPAKGANFSELAARYPWDADLCKAPSFLPSPPPSTEFPSVVSFPLPSTGPESSPASTLDHHNVKRAKPYGDARRSSSQEHRWPFPELIPSGLRAAPCSPLLTTRAVGDESSPPLSSAAQGRGRRPTDPRKHAHPGLAFGVVRNFQRVLNELQGLGHENSPDANDATSLTGLHASDSANQATGGSPWKSERRTLRRGLDSSQGEQHILATNLATKWHTSDSSAPCRNFLGHTAIILPPDELERTSLLASVSLEELDSEFLSLLLGKAAEEEACAEQLRAMADRLDRLARGKKRLAEAIARREP